MYLVTDDLREPQVTTRVDQLLELPASDIADSNVVHLAALYQVVQRPQGLLQWGAVVPAVSLSNSHYITELLY